MTTETISSLSIKAEATSKPAGSLLNKNELKRRIKDLEHLTAGDLAEALNSKVETIVKDAIGRAKANGRKQVRACDL